VIVVEDVHYRYEADVPEAPAALNGVHLAIAEGAFLAVMGPNGSGKTTLGRCLNGLIRPTRGRVTVDGLDTADVRHAWTIYQRVGMIFQNPDNQLVSTTVERELAFGLENLGVPSQDIRDRVAWALDRFRLASYRLYPPHRLSGGQKQRLAIAAVVLMQPRYLVCDEPTTLLDPSGRSDILSLIATLRHDHGMGIVYITQIPEEAVKADRVVLMSEGRMVAADTPARVFRDTERLRSLGLEPPLAGQLAEALRKRGFPVDPDVLCPDALVAAITRRAPAAGVAAEPPDALPSPHPAPGSSRIVLQDVRYTYQPGTVLAASALRGVTLRVGAGECVALTGANGSGKSTLIQHLNGLLFPASGTVQIDGVTLEERKTDLRSIRQRVGLVFQFPEAQLFEETVFDDVAFGPRNMGMAEETLHDRVYRALERVYLDPDRYAGRHPLFLSGGEKRRVALAGVLVMEPDILALDEPAAGLDPRGARHIESILRAFHAAGGTVVVISHDMDMAARLSDRVIVLNAGEIVADAPPRCLFADASRLAALSLDCPGLVRILRALRAAGFPVSPVCFEVEAAADAILRSIR
jgi:energy-coupling factor transport system ATP-binding protein